MLRQLIDEASDLGLPKELTNTISYGQGSAYLEAIAEASLDPRFTDLFLPLYHPIAAEISQRWLTQAEEGSIEGEIAVLACFARILPFATYLKPKVKDFLRRSHITRILTADPDMQVQLTDIGLQNFLLALFRLLSHDLSAFIDNVRPIFLCSLFSHEYVPIRYLAIECFCQVMHFADALNQDLIKKYIGEDHVKGLWEGNYINFQILELHEEQRWIKLQKRLETASDDPLLSLDVHWQRFITADLCPQTASVAGVLVPKCSDVTRPTRSTFVTTQNATINLREFSKNLHHSKPILLLGPSGAGKTAIVHEAARQLDKLGSMVTLHLNDQTDAKSLLGIYTSSSSGNGFVWQPGVLTSAVQDGRWVLIEDIDRAPADVIGLLRPLIENAELFLPSRKERLKPGDGFFIIGTIREARQKSPNVVRNSFLSNTRLWSMTSVVEYPQAEIRQILQVRFGKLNPFLDQIMAVHTRVLEVHTTNPAFKFSQIRERTIRDLIKWCRRLNSRIAMKQAQDGVALFSETFMIEMLKECVDCYAFHLTTSELLHTMASNIAEVLNIPPVTFNHIMRQSDCLVQNGKQRFQVGRAALDKLNGASKRVHGSTRFALTRTVRQNMEAIMSAVAVKEPLLLVGETGVGKTAIVQYIASSIGQNLTVINLSNQSEASDLLGGLKPVTTRSLMVPLVDEFNDLFDDTFSSNKNEKFQQSVLKAFAKQRWTRLLGHWQEAVQLALKMLPQSTESGAKHEQITKRRKLNESRHKALRDRWTIFDDNVTQMMSHVRKGEQNQIFAFVESRLVKAVRDGSWLLLDEINLATSETLDNILSLFHDGEDDVPYLLLAESGRSERIEAHKDFRIFAAMNPATDTGKRDLPSAIRAHFTELYIHAGDEDLSNLVEIIQSYLGTVLDNDKKAASDLARSYLALRKLNAQHKLTDGAGDTPHFSLRSLTRSLLYIQQNVPYLSLRRAMYEGLQMSFFTVLDSKSQDVALPQIEKHLLDTPQARREFASRRRDIGEPSKYVILQRYFVLKGLEAPDHIQSHYIRTKSVDRNLANLARAASTKQFPILLQGPTSAGKTSMVEYLAKYSGNKFVRINNHEHTDLQEYLGSYTSGPDGRLEYREGVLVEALRNGYWIVLDELNLAPSDVLEALNRLLDDNRELLIPESQEIVRPHPNFMLFATQNPAGIYGGRKRLSRAFRNRFLEIHIEDIPEDELEVILTKRAQIPPSFCHRIVEVYKCLSLQRQSSRLFEQRNSFATLRDLFRWASRPLTDWEELAHHGYMLLAERVRDPSEKEIVKTTIEEVLKVKINNDQLYHPDKIPSSMTSTNNLTWTRAMRRLFVLVTTALQNNEPVLLVGETGCGKTQVCQVVAQSFGRELHTYNAHSNTETGDLIGSQRPVRYKTELVETLIHDLQSLGEPYSSMRTNDSIGIEELIVQFKDMDTSTFENGAVERVKKSIAAYQSLFTWSDGSLVRAMKEGAFFLLDEISLADDSVLERMNSVLEPARTILLAEKGLEDNFVIANPGFQFLATMNPGGDYGKRELSAALRNRLTEIWVPPLSDDEDVLPILKERLSSYDHHIPHSMLEFARYFTTNVQDSSTANPPLRTLLNWTDFVREKADLGIDTALIHGAGMNFIDSLGANPAGLTNATMTDIQRSREKCLLKLSQLTGIDASRIYDTQVLLHINSDRVHIGPFSIQRCLGALDEKELVLDVPTTLKNCMRLVRALQIKRPILLEGNPGVGKTAIVSSLAKICGKALTRINLSDQTDLMDLFGADNPAENENVGSFVWRDGPMLAAMQTGGWVLLDEMNLASQSVLEGLNACLDHRKEVYIAELDRIFKCHPDFMLFATQNPHHQGGGRKGLPASFVNRFTVVYADPFQLEDLVQICKLKHPSIPEAELVKIISVLQKSQDVVLQGHEFMDGGPWELNLRDLNRWLTLCGQLENFEPSKHFDIVVSQRFRSSESRNRIKQISEEVSGSEDVVLYHHISPAELQVGVALTARHTFQQSQPATGTLSTEILPYAESVLLALKNNWPAILVGRSGSGKTTLIRSLAALSGAKLIYFSMNADIDTADLIGGYEQHDMRRDLKNIKPDIEKMLTSKVAQLLLNDEHQHLKAIFQVLVEIGSNHINISSLIQSLSKTVQQVPELQDLFSRVEVFQNATSAFKDRFVWNDGVLIDAIQSGCWLVLDNANLCNPSILDRLNSLLEPDGCMIVSEQYSVDGKPRVIRPHPDFRIVLTVDPRYGELSRAMRNRSLEVFMDLHFSDTPQFVLPVYSTRSSISQIRVLMQGDAQEGLSTTAMEPWISQLSHQDTSTLFPLEHYSQSLDLLNQSNSEVVTKILPGHARSVTDVSKGIMTVSKTKLEKQASMPSQPQVLLVNQPWLRMMLDADTMSVVVSRTRLQFFAFALSRCQTALQRAYQNIPDSTHGHSSVLQKSVAHIQKRTRSFDEGLSAFEFLSTFTDFCVKVVANCTHAMISSEVVQPIRDVVSLLLDLFALFSQRDIPEDQLQAYKAVSHDVVRRLEMFDIEYANEFRDKVLVLLGRVSKLTSGLGLQRMWPTWKGYTAPSFQQIEIRMSLEGVVKKFDQISKILPQPRAQLADLRLKLITTISDGILYENTSAQIDVLQNAVDNLIPQQALDSPTSPHFGAVFDIILSKLMLQNGNLGDVELQKMILFGHNSCVRTVFESPETTNALRILQRIEAVAALAPEVPISPGELPIVMLLEGLSTADAQPLGRLAYAQEELLQLVETFSSRSKDITAEAVDRIDQHTISLIHSVLNSFDHYESEATMLGSTSGRMQKPEETKLLVKAILTSGKDVPDYLRETIEHYFLPATSLLEQRQYRESGQALLLVSLSCLRLLVTDRVFDPSAYPQLVKSRYEAHVSNLAARIESWKLFQHQTTGQDSSTIIEMFRQDMLDIGQAPAAPVVYRPGTKYMVTLQGEFVNILRTIVDANIVEEFTRPGVPKSTDLKQIAAQLTSRVNACIERLSNIHRAYDDLTMPVKGLLYALSLSISMIIHAGENSVKSVRTHSEDLLAGFLTEEKFNSNLRLLSQKPWTQLFTYLKRFQIRTVLEKFSTLGSNATVSQFVSVVDQFYVRWKKQLTKDQAIAVAQSKYYTYRGHDEGSEEDTQEITDMFPTFTEDNMTRIDTEEMQNNEVDWQTISIKVARIHRSLWNNDGVTDQLKEYIKASLEDRMYEQPSSVEVVPSVILIMEEKLKILQEGNHTGSLNVYTDSSALEARKLFDIVRLTQKRFNEIVEAWPEHSVATEALTSCRYVLASKINDPIALLLTRTERLLEIIAQWQSVASREWSVQNLIDAFTQLIIHWRRLELSSWSRLLDIEDEKVGDAADAWYFIAYEAVIYNSLLITKQSQDVSSYSENLAKTLEEFLKLTTFGQYSHRLKLLTVFSNTVSALADSDIRLKQIRYTLINILTHYARYESHITNQLTSGRASLEKSIVEQIQLASWKDTNITALRDSARRSHYKLFKIVKKYRTLLSQPIANLEAIQDFESAPSSDTILTTNEDQVTDISVHVLSCSKSIKDWNTRPERLRNTIIAARTMRHVYNNSIPNLDVQSELRGYYDELSTAVKELRDATPSILTDQNSSLIRDLKQRKRRLLAETMRELTQMGIRRNLSTAELESQSSIFRVLANTAALDLDNVPDIDKANKVFHAVLDVIVTSRQAALKHSDELTDGEIKRGLGLLEGLLRLVIDQRKSCAENYEALQKFHKVSSLLKNVCSQARITKISSNVLSNRNGNLKTQLTLIVSVMHVFEDIVRFQGLHGKFDITEIVAGLRKYRNILMGIVQMLDDLGRLPQCLTSDHAVYVCLQLEGFATEIETELGKWTEVTPQIEYLSRPLQQMLSNLRTIPVSKAYNHTLSHTEFDKDVQELLESTFVLLQHTTEKLKTGPNRVDEPGWLTRATRVHAQSVCATLVNALTQKVDCILQKLHSGEDTEFQLILSLICITSPVILQFESLYNELLHQGTQIHIESCRLAILLGKSFTTLARDGFCSPSEPHHGEEQSGKVEQGTGLGEGEAAEDISKDVGDDEDLTDLAQADGEREEGQNEIEKSKDAVDLGADDLEGEMGSGDERGSDDDDRASRVSGTEDQEMDQETGSVDDLDPSAVDEKMWDAMQKEMEQEQKEMKGRKCTAIKSDEQTERQQDHEDDQQNSDLEAQQDADQSGEDDEEIEGEQKHEGENLDPHLDQEQALELSEEMQLNGEEEKAEDSSDIDMDDMSDVSEQVLQDNKPKEPPDEDDAVQDEESAQVNGDEHKDETSDDNNAIDNKSDDDEAHDRADEQQHNLLLAQDDVVHSIQDQEGGDSGVAATNQANLDDTLDDNAPQDQQNLKGSMTISDTQDGKQSNAEEQGTGSEERSGDGTGQNDERKDKQVEAIQRLADVLDQYHRRRDIFTASENDRKDSIDEDVDMAEADFEHLNQENDDGLTQALGTANTEVNQKFDLNKAIEESRAPVTDEFQQHESENEIMQEDMQESLAEKFNRVQNERSQREQRSSRSAIVPESVREKQVKDFDQNTEAMDIDEELDEVAESGQQHQLSLPTSSNIKLSMADAQQLWSIASSKTQALSMILTEQLRLILQPTTATKLRGDFRTGKRLNIRRIIPYIASGYKRDKIWMRRSVPSKRNYQIMLAVDDSKSMAESGADILALETLCMLSRSLSMLEAGELSIVAFGQDYSTNDDNDNDDIKANGTSTRSANTLNAVKVAHPFSQPFSPNQAGPTTFSNFTFAQTGTNIRALLTEAITLFADARVKSSARDAADLWQLQIIISDGHIGSDSDDAVRRLVRKAREAKIMCVFVVVDSGEESIVDLKEVSFDEKTGEVTTRRYLENFPFPYYVVVREVRDLPGVLSRVLKGWFEGVVEQG